MESWGYGGADGPGERKSSLVAKTDAKTCPFVKLCNSDIQSNLS